MCRNVASVTFVPLCMHSDCKPFLILKEIRTNNAMRINCTPPWHYVEEAAEVHVGCLEPSSDSSLYSYNQTQGSEPHLTLTMCSLCRYCFSQSPRNHCKTAVGSPCPVHRVPEQLGFCTDGNANPCGEFGEHFIRLNEVRELAVALTCADFATWRPLPARHCQVQVPKMDDLKVYCPSLILLDAISIPTIAEYCGYEHHVFENAVGHHAV